MFNPKLPIPDSHADGASAGRRRPKPGQRRKQILQTLAAMLQQPGTERVTTASLARQLKVSEAALYRHFASKAQMFEELIDFIEQSVFALVQEAGAEYGFTGIRWAERIVFLVIQFGERNPGMARVMVGDALVYENERLQERMNLFFSKLETMLYQCLHPANSDPDAAAIVHAQLVANTFGDLMRGRLQRYVRTGFHRPPTDGLDATLALIKTSR